MDTSVPGILELADWRRRVFGLYADIRTDPEPRRAWDRWCATRRELFREHPASPIPVGERAAYAGPLVFDYDPQARTTAEVRPLEPVRIQVDNSDGVATPFVRFGAAAFELYGEAATLELFWLDAYGGGLYLSFRDATSGRSAYGGGRYLLDTVKGADLGADAGRLVLDFNFAYNPSCSYDVRWSCPLPPPANRLGFAIAAGERVTA